MTVKELTKAVEELSKRMDKIELNNSEFEKPFYETQALITEAAELLYEKNPQTGTVKVFEKGTNTKDRYVSAAMGSYFIDQLELDMIGNSSEYEYVTLCN